MGRPRSTEGGRVPAPADSSEATAVATDALGWLLRFRWAMVAGEIALLAGARQVLGLSIPWWVGLVPLLLALTNLAAQTPVAKRIAPDVLATGLLLLDTVLLTALFIGSGGPVNPFTVLYLVNISFSALVLRPRLTWVIATASLLGFTALFVAPSGREATHDAAGFAAHLRGMWAAFLLAALATALFVTLLRRSRDRRSCEVARLRDLASRYERLAVLSTFAAGAAHELATPLGTVALLAGEAGEQTPENSNLRKLLDEIKDETKRCRLILDDLAGRAGEAAGEAPRAVPIADLVDTAVARLSAAERERVTIRVSPEIGTAIVPERALVRSLVTMLRNATDASPFGSPIEFEANIEGDELVLSVLDRGVGPSEGLSERVGEPFLSTKDSDDSLGLGLFAASQLAQLLGGRLSLARRDGGGAVAEIRLPVGAAPIAEP